MSSSLTHLLPPSQPQASASARLLTPTTQPIPLLSSFLAKRYSYAHTLLVPLYYYLRASALVGDPFPVLLTDLLFVALAQALFCALCLPSAGTWVSGTAGGKILEGTAIATKSPKGKGSANVSSTGSTRKKVGPAGVKGSGKGAGGNDGAGGSWRGRVMVS